MARPSLFTARRTAPVQPTTNRPLPPPGTPIAVAGMHGMGDNLHQRGILRQLMAQHVVYLQTPWPCLYYDLVGPQLKLVRTATALRTQAKNAAREAARYTVASIPPGIRTMRVWYTGQDVRKHGSVLGAMAANTHTAFDAADFRFRTPLPEEWQKETWRLLSDVDKPILLYRPLVERTEWTGCANRNPEHGAYHSILAAIRDDFFVVSIADLEPDVEWISSMPIKADLELHRGELSAGGLVALTSIASLVYCSPGFAVIMAQSVETPVICVFGGYECSITFSGGSRFAPTLAVDPIAPCLCFSHTHACAKTIDVGSAWGRARAFVAQHVADTQTRRLADRRRLEQPVQAVHERG